MSAIESKSKIRPQQSCSKCRERKVKCDRNIPCEACIHRGVESECTYLTSPEDRAHISQAEIIDRLRREVAQLRTQLNQTSARGPSLNRRDKVYARKNKAVGLRGSYTAAAGFGSGPGAAPGPGPGSSRSGSGASSAEPTEAGSWAGSSPSSISTTTRKDSVTVTSPDSTGSDSGAGAAGYVQPHVYPGSTGSYGTQMTEVDMTTATDNAALESYLNEDTLPQFHAGSISASSSKIHGPTSGQGLSSRDMHSAPDEGLTGLGPMNMRGSQSSSVYYDGSPAHALAQAHTTSGYHHHGGGYTQNTYDHTNMHTMATKHEPAQRYTPSWNQGHPFPQIQPPPPPPPQIQPHPYPDTRYYPASMNTNTFTPTDSSIYPSPHIHSYHTHTISQRQTEPYSPPHHPTEYQIHAMNSIPDSWKGPDKQALLETILETITSCDEERVDQVVTVVRTSETPEEAVSGICRVLGISGDRPDLSMGG